MIAIEGTVVSLGRRCPSFGPRRVDCDVRYFEDFVQVANRIEHCDHTSVQLQRPGILRLRGYACENRKRAVFRKHPRWHRRSGILNVP